MSKSFFEEDDQKKLEENIAGAMSEENHTEESVEETRGDTAQNIKINNVEYSHDDLEELVALGNRAREIGENHGGFDKYVSEFGKKSQRIGELKEELESLKNRSISTDGELTDEATKQAQAAARKLGIVLTDDVKNMVTEILNSEFDSQYMARRSGEKLLDSIKNLEKDIDGSDGRPKFDGESVLKFMEKNPGFSDPQRAYEAMNLEKISEWRAEQIINKKRGGITTMTDTNSAKMPNEVAVNKDNLHDLMSEALNS